MDSNKIAGRVLSIRSTLSEKELDELAKNIQLEQNPREKYLWSKLSKKPYDKYD